MLGAAAQVRRIGGNRRTRELRGREQGHRASADMDRGGKLDAIITLLTGK
jgi:hypothetical protein